jgi:hypothetical protein
LYTFPCLILDKHPILEAAKQQMPTEPFRKLNAVLLFKWPPYLAWTIAFPVVTAWVPSVQFISLGLLYASSFHAMLMYGDQLVADPMIASTCKRVAFGLAPLTSLMTTIHNRVMKLPTTQVPSGGEEVSCQQYIFATWLVSLAIVFWVVLFWRARNERKERAEYLQTLGIRCRIAWPHLRVMVVQLVILQLFLTFYLMLLLEDSDVRGMGQPKEWSPVGASQ